VPPIHLLTGLIPEHAAPGRSSWSIPASPWLQSAAGLFPGGALAVVADAALGGAIYNVLPTGTVLATSELSMNFIRPATPASERLTARARLIHSGSRQGLSDGLVEDVHGRLLAHATSRCVLRPLPFEPPPPPEDQPARIEEPAYETPDPYLRPVEGAVLPQSEWDASPGLEIIRSWQKGEREPPPICRLCGWHLLEVDEGAATWSVPASQWFCTGFGTFYGGITTMILDVGIITAITTTLPPGTSFGTLDLKVNFLRPVTADSRDLRAQARVVHRGRTMAVTTAELEDADGKVVAMATSSALIMPGVPWQTATPRPTMDEAPAEAE
jgi:uncharacterized protein (TIGR00369 family)